MTLTSDELLTVLTAVANPHRMRIEGNNHRLTVGRLRSPYDLIDHMPMRTVHAVEVADADDRGTEVARDVVELVKDFHVRLTAVDAERAEK